MNDSLFGFSSIAAFICTILILILMCIITNKNSSQSVKCISFYQLQIILYSLSVSVIFNGISAFAYNDNTNQTTRKILIIFPFLITFLCWLYILMCKLHIQETIRMFLMMTICSSFLFHIQCFISS